MIFILFVDLLLECYPEERKKTYIRMLSWRKENLAMFLISTFRY